LETLFCIQTKLPITLLKYSPNGHHLLAVMSPPSNFINVYDVQNGYLLRGSLQGSDTKILAIDYSDNGKNGFM
jgi:WD40 repeat protein